MSKKRNQNSFLLMLHGGVINQNIPECLDDLIAIQEKLFDFGLTLFIPICMTNF